MCFHIHPENPAFKKALASYKSELTRIVNAAFAEQEIAAIQRNADLYRRTKEVQRIKTEALAAAAKAQPKVQAPRELVRA